MTIYTSPRRRRRPWKRILLITGAVVLTVVVAMAAAVAWWANGLYGQIASVSPDVERAQRELDAAPPLPDEPAIALVIGSDHRKGDGADARSDTLMLVRVDPGTKLVSLMSLPRDLLVDIPGYGTDKINAAYSEGGAQLAVKTVHQLTGLPIDYLVSVDFRGFTDLVNDFGGVYVNVDQRYFHDNAQSFEKYDEIDLLPGYQLLHGADALDFARFRHTDSDFYRNARQQLFLQAFESRVSGRLGGIGLGDLPTVRNVLETIAGNVQVTGPNGAPSVKTLIDYARLAYSIKASPASVKLAATEGLDDVHGSYVEASEFAIRRAVRSFTHPQELVRPNDVLPEAKKTGAKTPKEKGFQPAVDPETVTVTTLNGNGESGVAEDMGGLLAPFGYQVSGGANADSFDYAQTQAYYRPGFRAAARDVAEILGYGRAAPIPGTFTQAADVVVVVGDDFEPRTAVKPPKPERERPALPPDIQLDDAVYRDPFARAARDVGFPVLYPTATQTESTFQPLSAEEPVRTYRISAGDGDGDNSLYAVYHLADIAGAYWGIQETTFTDAPVLDSPDAIRRADGRRYRFFFNGSHIHLIAFEERGAVYWVTNTLRDDLSNRTIVALARSLRPVSR